MFILIYGFDYTSRRLEARMRVDLYTKAVLTVIALTLLAMLGVQIVRPIPVLAQDYSKVEVSGDNKYLVVFRQIGGDIDLFDFQTGNHLHHCNLGTSHQNPLNCN